MERQSHPPGAQTERPGDATPVWVLLGGGPTPAACLLFLVSGGCRPFLLLVLFLFR